MNKTIEIEEIRDYVNNNIIRFHKSKIDSLKKLKLIEILKRKNPYLFKAKNILSAQDLVKTILDAYLSSQEETIFGDFLEGLAIFISNKLYDGKKSSAEGIDLEFEKESIKYIVSIKSGPNWGNSSQIKKMIENFRKAKKILRTGNSDKNIIAINGCCYGREKIFDKGDYFKYCGQKFWEFISGDRDLYIKIIEPLGFEAKKRNEEFIEEYYRLINNFTSEFLKDFCLKGRIDWGKLVKFNSGYIDRNVKGN
jgi:hypothetical protein